MTRAERAAARVEAAARVLAEAGYTEAGTTREETVRIGTMASPIYGGSGGELRTFGGRHRFERADARATVGPQTTCLYRVVEGKPTGFVNVPTSDLDALRKLLRQLESPSE